MNVVHARELIRRPANRREERLRIGSFPEFERLALDQQLANIGQRVVSLTRVEDHDEILEGVHLVRKRGYHARFEDEVIGVSIVGAFNRLGPQGVSLGDLDELEVEWSRGPTVLAVEGIGMDTPTTDDLLAINESLSDVEGITLLGTAHSVQQLAATRS